MGMKEPVSSLPRCGGTGRQWEHLRSAGCAPPSLGPRPGHALKRSLVTNPWDAEHIAHFKGFHGRAGTLTREVPCVTG